MGRKKEWIIDHEQVIYVNFTLWYTCGARNKKKSLGIFIQNDQMFLRKINLTYMKQIKSLQDCKEIQNGTQTHEISTTDALEQDIEVRIFCFGAVKIEMTTMDVGCIAFDFNGSILAKLSKYMHGNPPLLAEVFAVEEEGQSSRKATKVVAWGLQISTFTKGLIIGLTHILLQIQNKNKK